MGPYRPAAYLGPQLRTIHHGPAYKSLGQTFDEMLGLPACTGVVCRLIFHTGATALAIHVATTSKSTGWSVLAWIIGIGQGFAGILDIVSLIQRAAGTHPPEK